MSRVEFDQKQHLETQQKRRKKLMLKLFVILLILVSVGIILTVTYLMLLKGNKEEARGPYAELRKEYVYDPNVDIQMVDLKDIPSTEPIEEWATKKDEEYVKDISEAFPEEVSEPVKAAVKEQEISYEKEDIPKPLDIGLSAELQIFTKDTCDTYGVPYSLILALMETESTFRSDIGTEKILGGEEGGARYYGYMQLSWDNCEKAKSFGLDAHTPEGNIEMAILLISGYLEEFGSPLNAIMAYKGGSGAAKSWIESGYELPSAKHVVKRAEYYEELLEGLCSE